MKQIKTLEQIHKLSLDKKAIFCQNSKAIIPAAFMISMPGFKIFRYLRDGIFEYEPKGGKPE